VSILILLPGEQSFRVTAHFSRSGCSGLILPDRLRFGNAGKLQNLVRIIGENSRYIEPIFAEIERACQEGGSHKDTLYEAE